MPRRSRAYRRFHTDRVIAKRAAQAKRVSWWGTASGREAARLPAGTIGRSLRPLDEGD